MSNKNWMTTLAGVIASLPSLLHAFGYSGFGHFGSVSVDQALAAGGVLALGFLAKDKNVTGGTVQQ